MSSISPASASFPSTVWNGMKDFASSASTKIGNGTRTVTNWLSTNLAPVGAAIQSLAQKVLTAAPVLGGHTYLGLGLFAAGIGVIAAWPKNIPSVVVAGLVGLAGLALFVLGAFGPNANNSSVGKTTVKA